MRRDAVTAIPVEVEAHAVEGHAGRRHHPACRGADRARPLALPGRQVEVGHQPRDVHVAVVHPAPLGLPRHGIAQLREPDEGRLRRHEICRIDDTPSRVLHEDGFAGLGEERYLRHGTGTSFSLPEGPSPFGSTRMPGPARITGVETKAGGVQQLLKRLDAAWRAFTQSYAGLPEPDLLQPGVTGAWSVRDIIGHVTIWEREALKHLPLILEGGRPPRYSVTYGGIVVFNAPTTERNKHLSLADVLRHQQAVHGRLIALIEDAPEDQLGGKTRFRRRLRLDTYGHYPLHARAIREWREQRPLPA